MTSPAWMQRAACKGMDPAIFVTDPGEPTTQAKRVCAGCPVRQECLDYALDDNNPTVGVWGCTSGVDRRFIRWRRTHTSWSIPDHGTDAGYQRHKRLHENVCPPCMDAHRLKNAKYDGAYNQRRREAGAA